MTPRQLARAAMQLILQYLTTNGYDRSLGFTTYAVVVVTGGNVPTVYIAEAGASAPGIRGPLTDFVEAGLGHIAVIPCADTDNASGGVAVNDAERQAIRTAQDHNMGQLAAVVASRAFCTNCRATITSLGMTIHGPAEASM